MIQVLLPPEEKTKCSLRYQSRFSYLQHNLIGSTITDECIQAMRPFLEMFQVYDSGPNCGKRMLAFACVHSIRHLITADTIFIDDNFAIPTTQLINVLLCPVSDFGITYAYALLQCKTHTAYYEIFQAAVDMCGRNVSVSSSRYKCLSLILKRLYPSAFSDVLVGVLNQL